MPRRRPKNPLTEQEERLTDIFGSSARVKILQLFLRYPNQEFWGRRIGKITGLQIHGVFRELRSLHKAKFLKVSTVGRKHFFMVNILHPFFPELQAIFAPDPEHPYVARLSDTVSSEPNDEIR